MSLLVAAAAGERRRLLARLAQPAPEAARALIGCVLVRRRGRLLQAARIVETEAYLGAADPAAHAFAGRTPRTEPLWGPPGTLYVYFIYGVHYCLNLAVDREGSPECVLVRAAEPIAPTVADGQPPRPGALAPFDCRGPGRLCRALGIDTGLSGRHLFEPDWALTLREGHAPARLSTSTRVGIRRAAERLLRFCDVDSPAVSAPRPPDVSLPAVTPRSTPSVPKRGRR